MDHSPRFAKLAGEARARIKEISAEEVADRMVKHGTCAPSVLIDVREESEFAKGRITNARHIGRGILERDIEKAFPDLDTDIILYCGGGYRSALSADNLQRMGYTNVKSLAGGWRGWKAKGFPIDESTRQ